VKSLEPPDSHYLQAAIGWLELGNHLEANEELEKITPELRAHPDVLEVRYQIYAKAEKWEMADEIAHTLNRIHPLAPQFWLWRAYATRRMPGGGILQAQEILINAQPLFPKVWTIPYNLACYCAQTGRLEECKMWFKMAMNIDEKTVKLAAVVDPDLQPLWDSMGGTTWKRVE